MSNTPDGNLHENAGAEAVIVGVVILSLAIGYSTTAAFGWGFFGFVLIVIGVMNLIFSATKI